MSIFSMAILREAPEENEEYLRLEKLALLYIDGSRMLTTIERQKAAIFVIHGTVRPCYLCGLGNSVFEASRTVFLDDQEKRRYHCRGCGVRLHYLVPLTSWPDPFRWTRPEDLVPSEALKAVTQWEENLAAL
jgi:hypothetical protein